MNVYRPIIDAGISIPPRCLCRDPKTPIGQLRVHGGQDERVSKAFNWCKESLATVPVVQFPDINKKFVLTTDDSQTAPGAVIAQEEEKGERLIAFASKKLTPTESRYSIIGKELLGIIWTIKNFRPYMLGRRLIIKTDHKPLVWVEKIEETSARISRWKEVLAAYDFEITHTKGKENVVADCLSRQIYTIEGVDEGYANRFLHEWLGENSTASEAESEDLWGFAPLPEARDEQTNRQMTESATIINAKRRQLLIVSTT
ncbi:hypothetical protein AAG570_004330 [Ranatra chinensis]|uniref:Reverse transcriptase RNase H-like domain-containing protein n=1 Tax=Ranatra chinensis TaxID=642074 RepID=A0ABD0Y0J2_9HEMI